jgi:hypothetical protein
VHVFLAAMHILSALFLNELVKASELSTPAPGTAAPLPALVERAEGAARFVCGEYFYDADATFKDVFQAAWPWIRIQNQLRVRPSHGIIAVGDGSRHRIENDAVLRSWLLGLADNIREARKNVGVPVTAKAGQCRLCEMREHCGQARQ